MMRRDRILALVELSLRVAAAAFSLAALLLPLFTRTDD